MESGHIEKVCNKILPTKISIVVWCRPCLICKSHILIGDKYDWAWFIIDYYPFKIKRLVKLHYLCLQNYLVQSKGEPIIYG